jgi:uncharacterized cupredoxin-like copper-binding protein
MRRHLVPLLLVALAAVLAGCSAGEVGRMISVRMFDDMRYDPARFDVNADETVTFEVTNSGEVRHEFFIGTLEDHRAHADEMREGGHGDEAHDDPSALRLEPGKTGSLSYTFGEAGDLLIGCHEPGHYEAGMVAPVTVHP